MKLEIRERGFMFSLHYIYFIFFITFYVLASHFLRFYILYKSTINVNNYQPYIYEKLLMENV